MITFLVRLTPRSGYFAAPRRTPDAYRERIPFTSSPRSLCPSEMAPSARSLRPNLLILLYCILSVPLRNVDRERGEGKEVWRDGERGLARIQSAEPLLAPRQTLTYCNGACEEIGLKLMLNKLGKMWPSVCFAGCSERWDFLHASLQTLSAEGLQ